MMVAFSGTPAQAALVNVDVPLALYPVGTTAWSYNGFAIVAR